jgi:hypothetical protein
MSASSPSAADLLAELHNLGIKVQPYGDTLRYRPRDAMTPALLQRLQTHKAELLKMLTLPWGQSEADICVASALRRLDAVGWPPERGARRTLGQMLDAIDSAYLTRDFMKLQEAMTAFQRTLDAGAPVSSGKEGHSNAR